MNPGESVQFEFPIKAPSTPGKYHADFVLVAETLVRMSGGKFSLDIDVGQPPPAPSTVETADTDSYTSGAIQPRANSNWSGDLVSISGAPSVMKSGDEAPVVVKFKNSGAKTWRNSGTSFVSIYASTKALDERVSKFASGAWRNSEQATVLQEESVVAPGEGRYF